MTLLLPIHIIAGLTGIVSGAVAIFARKGAKLHRQSGMIFVYAMLLMSASGAGMAALYSQWMNVIAGALTFYMVMTAVLTVRRRARRFDRVTAGAMLGGLTVALASISLGIQAMNSATGEMDGYPPAMGFIFGGVALLAVLGDSRILLAGRLKETQRLVRHLWRMCFSLFVAAGSFFLGQAQVFPEPVRIMPLLSLPVLLVVLLMFYWLARVHFTQWRPRTGNQLT
jgi:uncharacterized membrane protein